MASSKPLTRIADHIRVPFAVARSMGPAWVMQRARGVLEKKLGTLERHLPNAEWAKFDVQVAPDEFRRRQIWPIDVQAAAHFEAKYVDPNLQQRMAELRLGKMAFFSGKSRQIGWPPAWHYNADDDCSLDANQHFSRINPYSHGDIKNYWELGRFSFTWILCRAHFAGIADDAAELFFQAVADFAEQNPTYRGPHWMCGQEAALRVLAIAGGWSVFSSFATDADVRHVVRLFVATGQRILTHISYALSQKNNHGLSEAMGLLVIGLALPEYAGSAVLIQRGRDILERESKALVDADGGFSQQSANYHRVMIHVLTAALTIAGAHGIQLPECKASLHRSSKFLHSLLMDHGRQPRYGHDDGAHVLDWTSCGYDDFRPALQESSFASGTPLPVEAGPWDAGLAWLGCDSLDCVRREVTPRKNKVVHKHAGIAVLRGLNQSNVQQSAFVRIPPAVYRPGQVDAMHADIWLNDVNVAIDPGTYRYNSEGPWSTIPLALGGSHNVIGSAEGELAKRVGRFLFVPWPKVEVDESIESSSFSGEPAALVRCRWNRPIGGIRRWERQVEITSEGIEVVDNIKCRQHCPVHLRWQLADGAVACDFDELSRDGSSSFRWWTEAGLVELVIAKDGGDTALAVQRVNSGEGIAGWFARRYGELSPCHTVTAKLDSGISTQLSITSRFRVIHLEQPEESQCQ